MRLHSISTITALCVSLHLATTTAFAANGSEQAERPIDPRRIESGLPIPDEGYCDQPYVVHTGDGGWLCCLTTGPAHEGAGGQHVVCTRSPDHGRTWSELIDIEPSGEIEASWVVPLRTPTGRVYAFYDFNGDRVGHGLGQFPLDGRTTYRADMLGWYCYRYSDDDGRTWSERHRLPMRVTACDRANQYEGRVQIFWGIDKPKADDGVARFAFTKLGRHLLDDGEGWLYASDNLLTEQDPDKIRWTLLPEDDQGIRNERFGSVQEEHNMVPLGGGRLYMVYRTTMGHPCHAYSDDGGATWTTPEPMTYVPNGRIVRTSRACPKLWKCVNGKYLFWYHNHGGKSFDGRNPAWISGGVLRDGRMHWSEPEILLYAADPNLRMSYPDLIEEDGRYWITETQKTIARVHEIDPTLFEGLWSQGEVREVATRGLAVDFENTAESGGRFAFDKAPDISKTGGLSIDATFDADGVEVGDALLDSRDEQGRGLALLIAENEAVRLLISDGVRTIDWTSDEDVFADEGLMHVTAIVDAGPRIVTFVINGKLCDGAGRRQYGWGRFDEPTREISGRGSVQCHAAVHRARVYDRYLRTSEAVANFVAMGGPLSR